MQIKSLGRLATRSMWTPPPSESRLGGVAVTALTETRVAVQAPWQQGRRLVIHHVNPSPSVARCMVGLLHGTGMDAKTCLAYVDPTHLMTDYLEASDVARRLVLRLNAEGHSRVFFGRIPDDILDGYPGGSYAVRPYDGGLVQLVYRAPDGLLAQETLLPGLLPTRIEQLRS
jgi:hypothetical protein